MFQPIGHELDYLDVCGSDKIANEQDVCVDGTTLQPRVCLPYSLYQFRRGGCSNKEILEGEEYYRFKLYTSKMLQPEFYIMSTLKESIQNMNQFQTMWMYGYNQHNTQVQLLTHLSQHIQQTSHQHYFQLIQLGILLQNAKLITSNLLLQQSSFRILKFIEGLQPVVLEQNQLVPIAKKISIHQEYKIDLAVLQSQKNELGKQAASFILEETKFWEQPTKKIAQSASRWGVRTSTSIVTKSLLNKLVKIVVGLSVLSGMPTSQAATTFNTQQPSLFQNTYTQQLQSMTTLTQPVVSNTLFEPHLLLQDQASSDTTPRVVQAINHIIELNPSLPTEQQQTIIDARIVEFQMMFEQQSIELDTLTEGYIQYETLMQLDTFNTNAFSQNMLYHPGYLVLSYEPNEESTNKHQRIIKVRIPEGERVMLLSNNTFVANANSVFTLVGKQTTTSSSKNEIIVNTLEYQGIRNILEQVHTDINLNEYNIHIGSTLRSNLLQSRLEQASIVNKRTSADGTTCVTFDNVITVVTKLSPRVKSLFETIVTRNKSLLYDMTMNELELDTPFGFTNYDVLDEFFQAHFEPLSFPLTVYSADDMHINKLFLITSLDIKTASNENTVLHQYVISPGTPVIIMHDGTVLVQKVTSSFAYVNQKTIMMESIVDPSASKTVYSSVIYPRIEPSSIGTLVHTTLFKWWNSYCVQPSVEMYKQIVDIIQPVHKLQHPHKVGNAIWRASANRVLYTQPILQNSIRQFMNKSIPAHIQSHPALQHERKYEWMSLVVSSTTLRTEELTSFVSRMFFDTHPQISRDQLVVLVDLFYSSYEDIVSNVGSCVVHNLGTKPTWSLAQFQHVLTTTESTLQSTRTVLASSLKDKEEWQNILSQVESYKASFSTFVPLVDTNLIATQASSLFTQVVKQVGEMQSLDARQVQTITQDILLEQMKHISILAEQQLVINIKDGVFYDKIQEQLATVIHDPNVLRDATQLFYEGCQPENLTPDAIAHGLRLATYDSLVQVLPSDEIALMKKDVVSRYHQAADMMDTIKEKIVQYTGLSTYELVNIDVFVTNVTQYDVDYQVAKQVRGIVWKHIRDEPLTQTETETWQSFERSYDEAQTTSEDSSFFSSSFFPDFLKCPLALKVLFMVWYNVLKHWTFEKLNNAIFYGVKYVIGWKVFNPVLFSLVPTRTDKQRDVFEFVWNNLAGVFIYSKPWFSTLHTALKGCQALLRTDHSGMYFVTYAYTLMASCLSTQSISQLPRLLFESTDMGKITLSLGIDLLFRWSQYEHSQQTMLSQLQDIAQNVGQMYINQNVQLQDLLDCNTLLFKELLKKYSQRFFPMDNYQGYFQSMMFMSKLCSSCHHRKLTLFNQYITNKLQLITQEEHIRLVSECQSSSDELMNKMVLLLRSLIQKTSIQSQVSVSLS